MPHETNDAALAVPSVARSVAHLDQYFGLWAMEESRLSAQLAQVRSMDLAAHIQSYKDDGPRSGAAAGSGRDYEIGRGGIAIIDCVGMMTKYGSSMSLNPGTIALRRAVRSAADDAGVRGIMLRVDSPGGSVAGTGDLARDVAEAAALKPVHAYIEDLGASAAYWVASQARFVSANEGGIVGSIGAFTVIADFSAAAEKDGIKVHVIRAGAFKGAGTPGTKVTDEQLAEWQRQIDALNDLFVSAVAKGRRISEPAARALNDGRVHIGQAAVGMKLIDAVEGWDAAMQRLERAVEAGSGSPSRGTGSNRTNSGKGTGMSSTNTAAPQSRAAAGNSDPDTGASQPQAPSTPSADPPATIGQLKAEFPDSTAEFRERCLEAGMTMQQATKAYATEVNAENKRLKDQAAAAAAKQPETPAAQPQRQRGVQPVGAGIGEGKGAASGADETGDPVADFGALVTSLMPSNGGDRRRATAAAAKKNPDLHTAYLKANNPKRVHSLIEGRREE